MRKALNPESPDDPVDISPRTLAEQLFDALTHAILQGDLAPGSKINEPMLARQYGVSRGPLREALHRLQERHLIVRTANQGARVVRATPEMLANIFSVREALEGLAAREAAARISDEEITALNTCVRRHEAELQNSAEGQHNALGRADEDFHFRIAQASQNPLLIELLCNQFYPLLRLYRSRNDNNTMRHRALLEHRRILGALSDRDPELAELTMRRHIASARTRRTLALSAVRSEG